MSSGRLTALVSPSRSADVTNAGPLSRRHPTLTSNASAKCYPEIEYAPNDPVTRSYADALKTQGTSSSRMDSRKRTDPVLLVYPSSGDEKRSLNQALEMTVSSHTRELISNVGHPLELRIEVTSMQPIQGGGVTVAC